VAGNQIGHIPRQVAAKLAKYMDEHSLRVEGQLAGYIGSFECPLTVHMFGPDATSAAGQSLQSQMQIDRLPIQAIKEAEKAAKKREMDRQKAEKARLAEARLAAATSQGRIQAQSSSDWINQNTPGGGTQPEMSEILEASQRIDPRQMANQAENLGRNEDVLKAMPMAKKPEIVLTEMLPYQLQALQWLLDQESPSLPETSSQAPVQLWTRANQGRFTNVATNYSTQAPKLASGGILADDMGLGKTLEMIALIAADAEKHGRGTTLVVAPLSVLSNWTTQVSAHIKAEHQMTVHVYHGSGRVKMKAEDLKKHDIVLTTYQTLASDYMPGKGSKQPERKLRATGLYSMEWRRVILDEGHIIRNPQSKGAAAVNALLSRSRWALTGTPIVNSLKDLYSLLRFIGVTGGLERLDVFNSVLVRPLKTGNESAGLLLQAIMMAFTLRRRKDMGFIDLRLPELVQYVNRVQFSAKERERYDALEAEAKGLLHTYEKKTNAGQKSGLAYNGLLEILLRMRQTCNHWKLCAERVNKLLAQLEAQKTVDLTPENKKALQDLLKVQIDSMEDCAVCLETLHDPVITNCGHAFGKECIEKVIEGQHKCPMCRAELTDTTCLVEPANEFGDEGIADDFDVAESSSKLEGLLQILHATKARGEKTVVFSQWTSFLDIVAARLDRDGYKWCRIDGSMRKEDREQALQALKDDDQTTILLASLGVCAVGLNLTAASNVVLCDTWCEYSMRWGSHSLDSDDI
jgi:SWI/SNF-related matrix-associated actin-dependent regulator of chromatin subfamily A3